MADLSLDLTELEDLARELGELEGVRSVVTEPAKLVTPGAWLQVLAFEADTLSAADWRVDCNLVLAVSDTSPWRAAKQLVDLLNVIRPAIGNPAGPFTARTLAMPSGAALPALDVPLTVRITRTPGDTP